MRALVTGGAIRLGREISLYLAQEGYDVAVHYAGSEAAAENVVAEIKAMGRKAIALQADLLTDAGSQPLVAHATEGLGGALNLLVNNASIFEHDTIETVTRSSWDRHMESNLRAPFVLIQEFAKQPPRLLPMPRGNLRRKGSW